MSANHITEILQLIILHQSFQNMVYSLPTLKILCVLCIRFNKEIYGNLYLRKRICATEVRTGT
jgi:hypothetical protein